MKIRIVASPNGHDIISDLFLNDLRGLWSYVIRDRYILDLDIPIVSKVLMKHSTWPLIAGALNGHMLVIDHFRLQTLIDNVRLILLLPKGLVRSLSHILLLLGRASRLVSVMEAGHWTALSARSLRLSRLLGHRATEGSPNGPVPIVNHALRMGLTRWTQLVLVSAMGAILGQNRILQILLVGH